MGMDIYDYLQPLPLERVVQVHVSGPRRVDGRLVDAHQPLQKEDYDLLEFILARLIPRWLHWNISRKQMLYANSLVV